MNRLHALASGVAGAVALNVIHETARQILPQAPRMDVIGKRAIKWPAVRMGFTPPQGKTLYRIAIMADILPDAMYYATVAMGDPMHAPRRGLALGLLGGLGAVLLPPMMGLGDQPRATAPTRIMTIAWYAAAGLVAGSVARSLMNEKTRHL